jgi:3-hydroxybutyryl-CoA dehydrogenase
MHFFIPAPVMKLIEVIPGLRTAPETFDKAFDISQRLNKTPIKAPDTPAFLVNRLLVPMWNEAMFLVMEGNEPKDIDEAMKLGANLPMGPLELADFAGLDTVLAVMTEMYDKFGESKYRPCPLLRKMVNGKMLGRKTGKGFYNYQS